MASGNSGSFGAFIGGALIGGLAALLLAPQRGARTRVRIKERMLDMGRDIFPKRVTADEDFIIESDLEEIK
ncbi:MAG: YtxH domain-containing protein [Muribaculaceae bacterium]|nr:YtxH domain-containing protein [Muribaculaceae bacterium]MDE6315595.1 YtxH domain-containing protein [Muribaculaceae bacterium]